MHPRLRFDFPGYLLLVYVVLLLAACGGGGESAPAANSLAGPGSISATPNGASSITVSWTAATGASGYNLYRANSPGQAPAAMSQLAANQTATTFTDTGLAASTSYYYKVAAVHAAGVSDASGDIMGTTGPVATVAPATPGGLSASANSASAITVSWSAASDAESYDVYRSTSSGLEIAAMTPVSTGQAGISFEDTGLTASTAYYYRVVAVNIVGSSPASLEVSATTLTPALSAPLTPANVGAFQSAPTEATISWDAVTGATGYHIYRASNAGQETANMTLVSANQPATLLVDSGLIQGDSYYYRVVALNAAGSSAASAEAGVTLAYLIPTTPTIYGSYLPTSSSIQISWSTASYASAYDIYQSTTPGLEIAAMTKVATSQPAPETFTRSGLNPGTAYYFKVVGVNAGAQGAASAEMTCYTLPSPAFAVTASASSSSAIALSWSAVGGVSGYDVYRSTFPGQSTGSMAKVASAQVATTFEDSGLSASTSYYYKVVATVSLATTTSAEAQATTSAPPVVPPAAPSGVVSSSEILKSVSLSWPSVSGATGYHVYRSSVGGLGSAAMTQVANNLSTSAFTDTGLADATTYYYKVVAANSSGSSPDSGEVSATTLTPIANLLGGGIQGSEPAIAADGGNAATLAGSTSGYLDGNGLTAQFYYPTGITSDGTYLYVGDKSNHRIRRVEIGSGMVSTLAGSGTSAFADGTGTGASFNQPQALTSDGYNLFVADTYNHRIRKIVIASGAVTTLAGGRSGTTCDSADDGIATDSVFSHPEGITTDGVNLYVVERSCNRIRKVVIATGEVSTLAGGSASGGYLDGTGATAQFLWPSGIATDGSNLYVGDTQNHRIRKVVIASGEVSTLAGSGTLAYGSGINSGGTFADGVGLAASFNKPWGMTCDGNNLYVADSGNHRIRKIVLSSGAVTTLAGSTWGNTDGIGIASNFNTPGGITSDGSSLFVVELYNNKVRRISPSK